MATKIKITLEDRGQDFTTLYTDEQGIVTDVQPFQAHIWRGAIIPVYDTEMFRVGERLPIHHPPHIEYGFLRYKIQKIEYLYNEPQST